MRRLLELPDAQRIALKLALLALALPLLWYGLKFGDLIVGLIGGALFFVCWLYHRLTSGFDGGNPPHVSDTNPASGQAIIPGTRGLSSDGSYTGARE